MIELPVYAPAAARALNILPARLPAKVSYAGIDIVASLVVGDAPAVTPEWRRVTARFGSYAIGLALDPAALPYEARNNWPDIAARAMPESLHEILLELVMADLARAVEAWCGERPGWDAAVGDGMHMIAVARADAPDIAVALATMDDAALGWLAERCLGPPTAKLAVDMLPVGLGLLIDRVVVTRAELAGLALRTVMLLDRDPIAGDGTLGAVLCRRGYPGFRVSVAGSRASLESPADAVMDQPETVPPPSLDELPLVVECDIGQLTMPLARLRELAAGQVLDLGFDATRRVTLRVNGQAIATGELVRIEERTGVRITELHLSRGA